jgi:hypothetical protein
VSFAELARFSADQISVYPLQYLDDIEPVAVEEEAMFPRPGR